MNSFRFCSTLLYLLLNLDGMGSCSYNADDVLVAGMCFFVI